MTLGPARFSLQGRPLQASPLWAIQLANALSGTVINADSMQVYADLRVITARPTAEDEAEAPHRLFGHVGAQVNFSVGRYVADAIKLLRRKRIAGTSDLCRRHGALFKALTEGLSEMPAVPEEIRDRVRAESAGWGRRSYTDAPGTGS